MRSASLLGLMAVLVIVGLVVKRQLTAVRMAAPPPAPIAGTAPNPISNAQEVRDAVDDLMRQREAELQRLDE